MFALLKATLLLLNREWERNFSKKSRIGGTTQPTATISTKIRVTRKANQYVSYIESLQIFDKQKQQPTSPKLGEEAS